MTKAHLYNLHVRSADTTLPADDFIARQKEITSGVKRQIKSALKERSLSEEFSFAARVQNHVRSFQVYATPAAEKIIREIPDVEHIERMTISIYPLTRDI